MSAQRNPSSLQVQARSGSISASTGRSITATEDAALLRESRQFRKDMEREVERWMDVLMESPSVDRRFLRRASLYLQPNLYDEVLHERHLAMMCSYPACSKRPRRAYSEDARWRITHTSSHNISIRGPNKRDVVEVAGNPEDGFCGPPCAIRNRWYRSRLGQEPVWARPNIDVGDLKAYQVHTKQGRRSDALPGEIDLLEDMEERGEIVIENGQIGRVDSPQRGPETIDELRGDVRDGGSAKEESAEVKTHKTEPLPKSELVAETRDQPSTFMQRLESTLASLRIVEKTANTEQSHPKPSTSDEIEQSSPPPDNPASRAVPNSEHTETRLAGQPSCTRQDDSRSLQSAHASTPSAISGVTSERQSGQSRRGDEVDFDDESEDEETRKVFDLALAARQQLEDGSF